MFDPLRTDATSGPNTLDPRERAARIEQLLVAGLDHYLAGRYEDAITVWTRVAFLDRDNDRARAYIERARRAVAERQRESEELLHRGVAAFNRGETEEARILIGRAGDHVGLNDLALVFLERLNRLEATPRPAKSAGPSGLPVVARPSGGESSTSPALAAHRPRWWSAVGALAALAALAAAGTASGRLAANWLIGEPAVPSSASNVLHDAVPVVRRSELALARARALQADERLREALVDLDQIDPTDPLRAAADALRAELQRQLLEAGRAAVGRP